MQTPTHSPDPLGAIGTQNKLVIICGAPGVGKSTVAKLAADHLNATTLQTDVIRKQRYDNPKYSASETRTVYTDLLKQARKQLQAGETVVLDATFSNRTYRDEAITLGRHYAGNTHLFHVTCDEELVKQRIHDRDGVSDADFTIHNQVKDQFDPIVTPHTEIRNNQDLDAVLEQLAIAVI